MAISISWCSLPGIGRHSINDIGASSSPLSAVRASWPLVALTREEPSF
jgi:hypothetical protein